MACSAAVRTGIRSAMAATAIPIRTLRLSDDPAGGSLVRWPSALLPDFIPWAGETFDYSTSFRKMLASIAEVLSQDAPTSIELPAYEDYDDPHVLRTLPQLSCLDERQREYASEDS